MADLTVSGDLKYLLFIFLGIMVSILVLGYHHSPTASPQLGATQLANRLPTASPTIGIKPMIPVSTESYATPTY